MNTLGKGSKENVTEINKNSPKNHHDGCMHSRPSDPLDHKNDYNYHHVKPLPSDHHDGGLQDHLSCRLCQDRQGVEDPRSDRSRTHLNVEAMKFHMLDAT